MLNVHNLSFSYGSSKKHHPVFQDLTISFKPGLSVVLGPNGAGKSTLLKAIFGLLKYKGAISYDGKDLTAMEGEERTKLISYLPQMDIENSMLTVFEMVLLGRLPELGHKVSDRDLDIVSNTMDSLNIAALSQRNFGELSGGQKKLVFIAQTLVREPRLILLDEPVNSLDMQKQLELCQLLLDIVNKRQVDIIVVMHDINLAARYAQHVVVINKNSSLHSVGTPQRAITATMLQEVYGVISKVTHDENGTPVVSPVRSIRGLLN